MKLPKCKNWHIHYFVWMSSTDLIDFGTEDQKYEEEVEAQESEEAQEVV